MLDSDGGPTWVNWVATQGPKVKGGPKLVKEKHTYKVKKKKR